MVYITLSIMTYTVPTPYIVLVNYTWQYENTLVSSVAQAGDHFGWVLEASNNRLLVGNRKTSGPGFATLFVCSYTSASVGDCPTASWAEDVIYHSEKSMGDLDTTLPAYSAPVTLSYDGFGWSVALDHTNLAIGSYFDKGFLPYTNASASLVNILGAVYFYNYHPILCGTSSLQYFQLVQKTFGNQSFGPPNLFGRNISINGLRAVVTYESGSVHQVDLISGSFILEGFSSQSLNANDAVLGRIAIYEQQPNLTWNNTGDIRRNKASGEPYNVFAKSVSLSSDFLVAGAPIYNFVGPSSSYDQVIDFNSQSLYSFPSTYSGSAFVYNINDLEDNPLIGNFFYKNGYAVITSTASNYENVFTGTGSRGFSMNYQGIHTIFEHEYLVSLRPGEFNYSTNPTSLVQNPLLFDVNQDGVFDFADVDLIMRYLSKKQFFEDYVFDDNGIVLEQDNLKGYQWWDNKILLTESEDVLLQESDFSAFLVSSSFNQFTKTVFDYIETKLDNTGILDIDGDGKVNLYDGAILTAYFTGKLTPVSLLQWINVNSIRRYVVEINEYIGQYTGAQGSFTNPVFFGYQFSSSYDPTGSYLAPVITTIGLYDNNNALVAVGKLGKPIKNLVDWPLNFIVRFDT